MHLIPIFLKSILRSRLCNFQSVGKISAQFYAHSASCTKPDLVTMKFDTPLFKALFTPETNFLSDLFKKYNYELRIAGGAVRDLLMNKLPEDLDFATTATPDEMKQMFTTEGVRMLHKKGEGHGTVTARINDSQNFEVTTLRVDLNTDGRHAEVEFTTNWELDAGRRDLTINAMFLGLDGVLYDYFHGVDDLQKRLVKFVGDPGGRIQEDYLRILRYFRFYGRIGTKPDEHDPLTLSAIAENIRGLEKIAGERLWLELKKILTGNHAKHMMLLMLKLGIAPCIGLPSDPDIREFEIVYDRSMKMKPHAITLISALLRNQTEVENLHSRLKLSKFEKDLAHFIIENRMDEPGNDPIKKFKTIIIETKSKQSDTHEWVCELLKYLSDTNAYNELRTWKVPKFPLSGHVLIKNGFGKGRHLSVLMTDLKRVWIDSDFVLGEKELLNEADFINSKNKVQKKE